MGPLFKTCLNCAHVFSTYLAKQMFCQECNLEDNKDRHYCNTAFMNKAIGMAEVKNAEVLAGITIKEAVYGEGNRIPKK
jgi:hypothetical protein